jgi:polyhydroxybutyrate depolymerase
VTAAAVGLLAGLAACGGNGRHFLVTTGDGRLRTYLLHVPGGSAPGTGFPVVLALHGGGGNASQLQESLHLDDLADDQRFMAVYPEGIGRNVLGTQLGTWNGGTCCGEAVKKDVDDVAFIRQLLDRLARDHPVDGKRVYATGISNGGIMAVRLACELAPRIAAIAPIAGPGIPPGCAPERPVPVLFIHGTDDQCALYQGGEECGGCYGRLLREGYGLPLDTNDTFPCDGAEEQLAFFRGRNDCTTTTETFLQQGAVTCLRHAGCAQDATAALCTIQGGGHSWPGSTRGCDESRRACRAFADVSGDINQDIDANVVMWDFFRAHVLP